MRAQGVVDVMHDCRAFWIVQRLSLGQDALGQQQLFQIIVPVVGKGDVAGFFVKTVMFIGQ